MTTNGDLMSFDEENNANDRRGTSSRGVFDESWKESTSTSAFVARNPGGSSTMTSATPQQPFLEYERDDSSMDLLFGLSSRREPIMTDSGLLLTHRQSSTEVSSKMRRRAISPPNTYSPRIPMDYEHAAYMTSSSQKSATPRLTLGKVQRLFGLTKLMLLGLTTALLVGTMTIWHHSRHEKAQVYVVPKKQQKQQQTPKQQILLVPLNLTTPAEADRPPLGSSHSTHRHLSVKDEFAVVKNEVEELEEDVKHAIGELREEFEEWIRKHDKTYHSEDEKERRFHIWSQNHHETRRKNERHGPCRMTNQAVFGSNHFKDLTTHEFQARYLTGYKGPRTDKLSQQPSTRRAQEAATSYGMVLDPYQRGDPRTAVERHERVQKAYERHLDEQPSLSHFLKDEKQGRRSLQYGGSQASFSASCRWYDVSCWLRWFVNTYGFGIGGTMEPAYDSDSYPSSVDWRDMGAVSEVHAQGNCGACWAITAVETVESAYFIKKGTLYELAESEIILCDDSCEGCNGGWPQNAYEYVMDHNGLPLEDSYPYDGDTLYVFTEIRGGNQEYYEYYDMLGSYESSYCPAGSGDRNNNGGGSRYGKIKGYGYATDRCVCYTDGSGCDCDDQNEKIALMNLATYGPATVCLEASVWQDYAGGVLTSDSGCSASFLDMNHCVQAVGYAFVDSNDDGEVHDNNQQSGSGSGGSGHSGGSRDDGEREGYWIVRNQWSEDWGMNGYAYVAMGENTCGILNDMTQAYM